MALNLKALQDAYDSSESSVGGSSEIKWGKLKKGVNYIHILPPWQDTSDALPFYEVWLHFLNDESNKVFVFRCAKSTDGSRCVMCDRSNLLTNSMQEADKKLGRGLQARHRYLYNICNQSFEAQVLSVGPKCHRAILFELKEDVAAGFDPTAYVQGVMIKVERSDQGSWNTTEYRARAERVRIDLPVELAANHAGLTKLDQIYDVYTNAELTQVLQGNFDPKGNRTRQSSGSEQQAQPPKTTYQPVQSNGTVYSNPYNGPAIAPVNPVEPGRGYVPPTDGYVPQSPIGSTQPNLAPPTPPQPQVAQHRKPSLEEARRILEGGN